MKALFAILLSLSILATLGKRTAKAGKRLGDTTGGNGFIN